MEILIDKIKTLRADLKCLRYAETETATATATVISSHRSYRVLSKNIDTSMLSFPLSNQSSRLNRSYLK